MRNLLSLCALAALCAEPAFAQDLTARSLTLVNDQGPVVTLSLGANNDKPIGSRLARLRLQWHGDYTAEMEAEPGPQCCAASRGNGIRSQFQIWGEPTPDGTGRKRMDLSITSDGAGETAVIDATTNDPSLSTGQATATPLVINVGEGKGMYFILRPSDRTVELQDRVAGTSRRIPLDSVISRFNVTTPPDSARIAALEARIAKLELAMGPYADSVPPTSNFAERCPVLPNQRYSVWCRVQQIGVGIDANNVSVDGVRTRLAVVESVAAGGQPVGTAVFDKIRASKVCIGDVDCDPDWNAQLQIRGNSLANIGLEANLNKTDPQDPTHTHVSQINVSQDGGTRTQQNAQSTYSRGFVVNVNPCRPWMNSGPDSRSAWSYYKGSVDEDTCTPIPHDPTQDWVLDTDENLRGAVMRMWRPNWYLYFQYSSCIRCGDILAPAPRQ